MCFRKHVYISRQQCLEVWSTWKLGPRENKPKHGQHALHKGTCILHVHVCGLIQWSVSIPPNHGRIEHIIPSKAGWETPMMYQYIIGIASEHLHILHECITCTCMWEKRGKIFEKDSPFNVFTAASQPTHPHMCCGVNKSRFICDFFMSRSLYCVYTMCLEDIAIFVSVFPKTENDLNGQIGQILWTAFLRLAKFHDNYM